MLNHSYSGSLIEVDAEDRLAVSVRAVEAGTTVTLTAVDMRTTHATVEPVAWLSPAARTVVRTGLVTLPLGTSRTAGAIPTAGTVPTAGAIKAARTVVILIVVIVVLVAETEVSISKREVEVIVSEGNASVAQGEAEFVFGFSSSSEQRES